MRILTRATLVAFATKHPTAKPALDAWFKVAKKALWTGPADIKAAFASASFIGTDRVVFNLGGNNYRLIVRVDYARHAVLVRFVGMHKEYDRVNAAEV